MPHRIKARDIDKSLRIPGIIARFLVPKYTKRVFCVFNWFLNNILAHLPTIGLKLTKYKIPTQNGRTIQVLVYQPQKPPKTTPPGILWLHGGGYCMGHPVQDLPTLRKFIRENGCTIVAPCYTLAIHEPYPAALEDCYSTLLWMRDHSQQLTFRSDQIFVAGNSAGGGLTAALCILARDRHQVSIAFQMPLYPMLDDRPTTTSCANDAPVWNTSSNLTAWHLYLGPLLNPIPPYAAPARLTDYSNLPPAFTFIGDIDPFYLETIVYIQNLQTAGVPVTYKVYPGAYHGFDVLCPLSAPSRDAHSLLIQSYRYATSTYFKTQ